jgi:hypothetical protein
LNEIDLKKEINIMKLFNKHDENDKKSFEDFINDRCLSYWVVQTNLDGKHNLIIAVGGREASNGHFHVFRSMADKKAWSNGACLMFKYNAYYDHGRNKETLTDDELQIVINKLKEEFVDEKDGRTKSNWIKVIEEWNDSNPEYKFPVDLKMPKYDFKTIERYKDLKKRLKEEKMRKSKYCEYVNSKDDENYYECICNRLLDGDTDPDKVDLDDYAYLLELQWATSRVIDEDNPLIIAVGENEGTVPHFHVYRSELDFNRWENGACLLMLDNCYFDHGSNCGRLSKEELDIVIEILNGSIWRTIIAEWNNATLIPHIGKHISMPNYDYDTIKAWKENENGDFICVST